MADLGLDASFFATACAEALSVSRKWQTEQQRSESLFAALLDFHSRLRLLNGRGSVAVAELSAFGAGSGLEDVPTLLRMRHVKGVENLMSALRASCERFENHHRSMAEVHASMWERHAMAEDAAAERAGKTKEGDSGGPLNLGFDAPAWSVVGAGRGLDAQRVLLPPVESCIEWVGELDRQYTAELLLKLELIDSIDLSLIGAEDLHGVYELWMLQPGLKPQSLERLRVVVESLTVP